MPICIYESFADLEELVPGRCKSESDFQNYTADVEKQIKQMESQGFTVHRIIVKPEEFKEWLKNAGPDVLKLPKASLRVAYASAKFFGVSANNMVNLFKK